MPNVTDLGNQNLRIDNCIISYPTLFTPKRVGKPGQETGEPRFSANFILPTLDPAEVQILSSVCANAVRAIWPADDAPARDTHYQQQILALLPGGWWIAFAERDNCLKPPHEKHPGRVVLSANAKQDRRPAVFIDGRPASMDQQSQIFGGCVVNLVTRIYAYNRGGTGITAALNGVMLVDNVNVERLDGGISAAKAFGINPAFPPARAPTPDQPGPAQPPQHAVAPGQAPQPPAPGPQSLGPPAGEGAPGAPTPSGGGTPEWMR